MCETNFSLQKYYFVNSNGDDVPSWVPKVMSTFHNNPTVYEFEILVLLEQVLGVCVKRESSVRETFHLPDTLSQKSQRALCAKMSSEPRFQIS